VIVNGWYFYGLGMHPNRRFERLRFLARVPVMLWKLITNFRAFAALVPPLAHKGFDHATREWREQLAPAYRALVAEATAAVPHAPIGELPAWIDRIATTAGRNFGSVVAVAGYAAKAELPLLQFFRAHLAELDGAWLELVRSADVAEPAAHDVQGLDWFHPTLGELTLDARRPDATTRARIAGERDALHERARAALARKPKLVAKLDALVAEARRAHAVREEQARELTRRIGEHLVHGGTLVRADQVYFLERSELAAALGGDRASLASAADERHRLWQRQRRLAVPLVVGKLPPFFAKVFHMIEHELHGGAPARAGELRGHPGSPGRVTGKVRILSSPDEVTRLAPGDILVARVTTPAWTPVFLRAAAVITDTGSIASHASIVAREYGLPAVVATGDATSRLRDGQVVTVDGSRGIVLV
jgi:pyruvate,water dikinase